MLEMWDSLRRRGRHLLEYWIDRIALPIATTVVGVAAIVAVMNLAPERLDPPAHGVDSSRLGGERETKTKYEVRIWLTNGSSFVLLIDGETGYQAEAEARRRLGAAEVKARPAWSGHRIG